VEAILEINEKGVENCSSEGIAIFESLAAQLEDMICQNHWKETGVFVKLDSRSPKDVEIVSERTKQLVIQEWDKQYISNEGLSNQGVLDGYMKGRLFHSVSLYFLFFRDLPFISTDIGCRGSRSPIKKFSRLRRSCKTEINDEVRFIEQYCPPRMGSRCC
jgi:hypothetical protein